MFDHALRHGTSFPGGLWGLSRGRLHAGVVHVPGCRHINSPLNLSLSLTFVLAFDRRLLQMREQKGTERLGSRGLPRSRASGCCLSGVVIICCQLHRRCPPFCPCYRMSEWVPSEVTEARLQRLVEKGLLPPKKVAGWRAAAGDVLPFPQPVRRRRSPTSMSMGS